MHIVGIYDLGREKVTLAGALAAALGRTNCEAMARLRAPGEGPLVVAVFAMEEQTELLSEKLRYAGFKVVVLTADEIEAAKHARVVRRFGLGGQDLLIETDKAERTSVPFLDIALILRGTGIVSAMSSETVKSRSVSLGRAVLSGGMMVSKIKKEVHEVRKEEREGFINVYAGDAPALVFRENSIAYDSLGPELRPSRAANFVYLVSELRRRCTTARYDERLLTRAGQAFLLGPSLVPEESLTVAAALLSKTLRLLLQSKTEIS
jgi:hypothetical protein